MTHDKISPRKNGASRYAEFIIRFRWLAIATALLITAVAVMGHEKFGLRPQITGSFFGDDNPQLQAFEEMQRVYAKVDNILFCYQSQGRRCFSRRNLLQGIQDLTKKSWQTPYSSRVDSITNFQHSYAKEDDLIVRDLVLKSNPLFDR